MRKTDKIKIAEGLIRDKKNKLTSDEINFLRSRPGVNPDLSCNWQPLIVFSKDSKETVSMITRIADKLQRPIIKFIRKIIDFPSGYVRTERAVYIPKEKPVIRRVKSEEVESVPEAEVIQPEALPEHCPEPEEAEGIKDGTYKLSFPGIWDGLDDDDDYYENNMKIKIPFGIG